jgi:hypothetical protein
MPTMRVRVVCGRGVTIATFWPTNAFRRVDFPTFDRPTMTMPARCAIWGAYRSVERVQQRASRSRLTTP